MIVVVLEKCPLALRGDLTKWLQEISLGVYVGRVSARVRDELWNRICKECKTGRATMVFFCTQRAAPQLSSAQHRVGAYRF